MRKYELETIPIWDAYDGDSECPLCPLEERAEIRYVEHYLGSSIMVPETRIEVNEKGFCPKHLHMLFAFEKNRHGLGLISHTHLQEIKAKLRIQHRLIREGNKKKLSAFLDQLASAEAGCLICDRLEYTLNRYTYTIVYLWQHKEDFNAAFNGSKGFCLHHLTYVLLMAEERLTGGRFKSFLSDVIRLQEESYERLEGEILWFTQKFDYQNVDKSWGTSKDALHRVLQKLSGIVMKDHP